MAQHTPGPWAYNAHYGLREYIVGGSEHHTARIYMGEDRPFAEADARLIAAAPDLLAALEALLAEHEGMNRELRAKGRGRTEADNDAHPDAPAVMAAEAIRKARG